MTSQARDREGKVLGSRGGVLRALLRPYMGWKGAGMRTLDEPMLGDSRAWILRQGRRFALEHVGG